MSSVIRWTAATALAVVLLAASPAAAQVNGSTLEVERVVHDGTTVHLQVSVPPELRGTTLQTADFDVMSPSGRLDSTAEHLGGGQPQIILALDTGIGASGLTALQGAVLQFLVDLPEGVGTTIATTSSVAELGTDRQAAISAVQALTPTDPATAPFAPVVASALITPPVDIAPRAVVVASDADVGTGAAAGIDADQTRDVVWSVQLASSGATDPSLDDLAAATGGSVVPVTGPDQLLRAFDRVRSEWTGRYDITVDAPDGGQVVVTLATPDGPLSASVDLDEAGSTGSGATADASATTETRPASSTTPTTATDDDGGSSPWLWVFGIAALLAAWGVLFGVVLRRRVGLVDPTAPRPAVPPPIGTPAPDELRRTRTPVPPPDQPAPSATPTTPADPIVDLTRAHIVAPESAGGAVPSPAVRRDRTGRLAGAAEVALGELDDLRRRSPSIVPASIVLAFEAAASAWLDDDGVQLDDAFAVLTEDELRADSTLPSVLRGLRTGLLLTPACAEPEVPEHLFGAMAGASRGHPTDRGYGLGSAPAHPNAAPPPSRRGSGDLVEAARLAAEIERGGRYGRAGGVVARALLATWPSRHGRLDRCPLLLSPSASPPDGARLTDAQPTEHVDLLLWAIADAATRMITAQRATVELVGDYYRVAEDLAPGQAALVTDLLTRRLVTVRRVGEALGAGDDAALAHIERWVTSQRLEELPPAPGGVRRWIAMPIVDAVTGTLSGAGLPLEPFGGAAPASAGGGGRPDDHVVGV